MNRFHLWLSKINNLLGNTYVFITLSFSIALLVTVFRAYTPFTSPFDEHTHLSYVQYAFQWIIPADGYPMNTWAKQAFSCHPHALFGKMTEIPCGQIGPGKFYPTGGTNTSQAWPPIYFFLVAIFMRIPLLWEADPLFSARLVTAFFWALGTTFIGFQIWKMTKNTMLGLTVVIALVALPTFFYYTSNVSPHSLNPLLIGSALFISNKAFAQYEKFRNKTPIAFTQAVFESLKNKWIYAFIPMGIVFSLTIPQSLSILGLFYLYLMIRIWSSKRRTSIKLANSSSLTAIVLLSIFIFTQLYLLWKWQVSARAIPISTEVDPSGANQDPPDPQYLSPLIRISNRWFSFWPDALHPGFPAGHDIDSVMQIWIFVLAGLSITAIVIWKKSGWLGPLMLALLITAPIFSIAYDYVFTTDVPGRYGLAFPLVGIFSLANSQISKIPRITLNALVVATYVSVFVLEPGYIGANMCHLNTTTNLIDCSQ